jgi:hypothetical protein
MKNDKVFKFDEYIKDAVVFEQPKGSGTQSDDYKIGDKVTYTTKDGKEAEGTVKKVGDGTLTIYNDNIKKEFDKPLDQVKGKVGGQSEQEKSAQGQGATASQSESEEQPAEEPAQSQKESMNVLKFRSFKK